MTSKTMIAIPLMLGFAVSTALAGGALAIGASIPMADVKMKNIDGKELAIADVKKPGGTLVVFTCNHCPFAKAWETRIVELGNTYSANARGVPLRQGREARLPRDDRRQRRGAREGRNPVSEERARRRRRRRQSAGRGDEIDRVRHQIPVVSQRGSGPN